MTTTIETEIEAAEAKAREAREQASALRMKREQDRAEAEARKDRARDAFEADRRTKFGDVEENLRRQLDRFYVVVAEGGDYFAAYMDYRRAHAVASREHYRIRQWQYQRATAAWEQRRAAIKVFEGRRASLVNQVDRATERIRSSPTREGRGHPLPEELLHEVSAFVDSVNGWAEDEGLDYRVEQDQLGIPMLAWRILGDEPTELHFGRTWPSPLGLPQLLAEAIERADLSYQSEHEAEVKRDLAAFTTALG